ncbi:uncharacterized protein LOC126847405 [Adelges cooleyi]|uniref:uncharacterized protein LOC126847405 n=1 Tax=Adelges cooleyi TaxID=133065 RepID=UPI00217F483C|nr:uncharacterized protein LOC126847405 [Adelges cooleyi]
MIDNLHRLQMVINMIVSWLCIALMLFLNFGSFASKVKIENGMIRGQTLRSRDGRVYLSFTGIPYAKPPVGELRFKAPEPANPWDHVLDATQVPKICVQLDADVSDEDCLYLNVYTPKTGKKKLPVMFWIHGGGYQTGHGGPSLFGPEYFMDKDVVIVTVNYRIGALGFLSFEDEVLPGNYGMKDQVMALRWVKDNIRWFNGDPSQVTIFGGSAGGSCSGLHLLSPMSKGLFHKAILQSGSPLCPWAVAPPGKMREYTQALTTITGCQHNSSAEILQCLRNLPASDFIQSQLKLLGWKSFPLIIFSPVAERCNSKQQQFLCHHPLEKLEIVSPVPVIVGLNTHEGGLVATSLYNHTSMLYPELESDFNRLLSTMVFFNGYTTLKGVEEIGKRVKDRYFLSGKLEDNSHSQAVEMFGDAIFNHCVMDMALRWSSPLYFYQYGYQNEFSYNTLYGSCGRPLGVTHGDELNSLFKGDALNPKDLNEQDTKVSRLMINIWTRFATIREPTIDGTESGPLWPVFNAHQDTLLRVASDKPILTRNPALKDMYDFWKSLPLLRRLNISDKSKIYGDSLEIQTKKGTLKGQQLTSRDGRLYNAFTGIPYAKPPVGALRFMAPEEAEPWNDTLDATVEANACIQKKLPNSQEDCLYLNVYTPKVEGSTPVMFWIHGGAFSSGSGSMDMFGPDYFMDKDVVIVTINYRLGVLGYMSTEDDVIPGNFGMKDQVMALRWVQENIAQFGGDPNQVTIFGASTGGVSVGYHLLSPMSKGLFNKAIMQSGNPLCLFGATMPGLARQRAETVLKKAQCDAHNAEDTLRCLRKLPANFFTEVAQTFREFRHYPTTVFTPVSERCDSDGNAFLCRHQMLDFKQESFVPVLMGYNSGEGGMIAADIYNETSVMYQEIQKNFSNLNSVMMNYKQYTEHQDLEVIGQRLLKHYYPNGKIEDHTHSHTVEMVTDGSFLRCHHSMANQLASPVYFYMYSYQNEFSFNKLYGECRKSLGVTHGDELNSLFKMKKLNSTPLNKRDSQVSRLMIDIWTKFASSSEPTVDGTNNTSVWPIFHSTKKKKLLLIDSDKPKLIENSFENKYNFWNTLPILNKLRKENLSSVKKIEL